MDILDDFDMAPLSASLLRVGEPVPWPIYDDFGRLLLREGQTIQSEHQRDVLCQLGRYPRPRDTGQQDRFAPEVVEPEANPFAEFEDLVERLRPLFTGLLEGQEYQPGQVENRLYRLGARIHGLQEHHVDPLIGAMHLCHDHDYCVRHALHVAIAADILAMESGLEQSRRLGLSAAALMANIAMAPYQDRLDQHRGPLTDEQRQIMERHPEQAIGLLQRSGVDGNAFWLPFIRHHHERLDGSGYPDGLQGDAIPFEARLLALADVYTAMVSPRRYRQPLAPLQGLHELHRRAGELFDLELTRRFITVLSLYPPGSCVELSNGELAVVIGRSRDPRCPRVSSLRKADGQPFLAPRRRNTADDDFRIQRVKPVSEAPPVNPAWVWGVRPMGD
jgi:HD-GYP domain-containing protein (c-di-GMP phosphodiesterase class II)